MSCQNTLPDHSWIKLYVNIQVDWSGRPLTTLQEVKHKGSIRVFPLIQVFKFKYIKIGCRRTHCRRTSSLKWQERPSLTQEDQRFVKLWPTIFCTVRDKNVIIVISTQPEDKERPAWPLKTYVLRHPILLHLFFFTRCSSYVLSSTQEHRTAKKEQNTTIRQNSCFAFLRLLCVLYQTGNLENLQCNCPQKTQSFVCLTMGGGG